MSRAQQRVNVAARSIKGIADKAFYNGADAEEIATVVDQFLDEIVAIARTHGGWWQLEEIVQAGELASARLRALPRRAS
jgi:hypothetical protein